MGFLFLTAVYAVDVMGMKELQLLSCTLSICALFCTCALLRLESISKKGVRACSSFQYIALVSPRFTPFSLSSRTQETHTAAHVGCASIYHVGQRGKESWTFWFWVPRDLVARLG